MTTYRPTFAACLLAALCAACGSVPAGGSLPSVSGQRLAVAGHELVIDVFMPVHSRDPARSIPSDASPRSSPPTGAVILVHGFTRSRTTMNGHAAALAADGALVLSVDMPCTFDFACNARALAGLVETVRAGGLALGGARGGSSVGASVGALGRESGASLPPVDRVVLVGFSAGALSSLLAAGTPGVVGYVGLDPFDRTRPDGQIALGMTVAPTLQTPAVLVRAEPSRCNAQAVAAPWAGVLPELQSDTVIASASHCDFESPTDWICTLACGPADEARQARVGALLRGAVRGWLGPLPGP